MRKEKTSSGFFKKLALTALVGASLLAPFRGDFSPRRDSSPPEYSMAEKVVAAHRGGIERYPENSTKAFEYAGKTGAEMVELDVRKSADEFVVYHNSKINGRPISGLNYENIKKSVPYQVPTLDKVLEIAKKQGKTAIIDIKDKRYDPKIIEIAKKALPDERIIASSQYPEILRQIKESDPDIKTTLVVGTGKQHWYNTARILTGVVPWRNIKKAGADYVSVDGKYLNNNFYKNASKGDIGVLVYGIEKPSAIRDALQKPSVYGVIVDRPSEAVKQRNYLEKTAAASAEEKPSTKSPEHIINILTLIFTGFIALMLLVPMQITGNIIGNSSQNLFFSMVFCISLAILLFASFLILNRTNFCAYISPPVKVKIASIMLNKITV